MAKRRKFSSDFKAKVALAAIRGEMTANEIASKYEIHPIQVAQWKKLLLEGAPELLEDRRKTAKSRGSTDQQDLIDELYRQIGQLKVELDWMKKKVGGGADRD